MHVTSLLGNRLPKMCNTKIKDKLELKNQGKILKQNCHSKTSNYEITFIEKYISKCVFCNFQWTREIKSPQKCKINRKRVRLLYHLQNTEIGKTRIKSGCENNLLHGNSSLKQIVSVLGKCPHKLKSIPFFSFLKFFLKVFFEKNIVLISLFIVCLALTCPNVQQL